MDYLVLDLTIQANVQYLICSGSLASPESEEISRDEYLKIANNPSSCRNWIYDSIYNKMHDILQPGVSLDSFEMNFGEGYETLFCKCEFSREEGQFQKQQFIESIEDALSHMDVISSSEFLVIHHLDQIAECLLAVKCRPMKVTTVESE